MLGCYAQALSRDFQIDGHEIEAARWLTKDEVRARLANKIEDEMKLPATIAIAHYLIRDWVSAARSRSGHVLERNADARGVERRMIAVADRQ